MLAHGVFGKLPYCIRRTSDTVGKLVGLYPDNTSVPNSVDSLNKYPCDLGTRPTNSIGMMQEQLG